MTDKIERGFGRRHSIDLRDFKYMARPPMRVRDIDDRYWFVSPAWDQGETSHCVAYSSMKWLDAGPVRNKPEASKGNLQTFYEECQEVDEWPGTDYDGTSVRAAFKLLQTRGYISEYTWAFDVPTCANWILSTGPMVFGTDWLWSMMIPHPVTGFLDLNLDGGSAGGHAYLVRGVSRMKRCPDGSIGAFRILNSWGLDWGQKGLAWLSFVDAKILLTASGEACCAKELKAKAVLR